MVRFVVYFLIWILTPFLLHRGSCCVDGNIKQQASGNTIFSEFHKSVEPGDCTRDWDEWPRSSATKHDLGCVFRLHGPALLVARALCHVDALLIGRISETLGMTLWMGKNTRSIKVWILVGRDASWSLGSSKCHRLSQGELDADHAHVVRIGTAESHNLSREQY